MGIGCVAVSFFRCFQFACRVGGNPSNGAYGGLFYWGLNNGSSGASWNCGARVLMYQI